MQLIPFHKMVARREVLEVLTLLSWTTLVAAAIDCQTVTGLFSACSTFITYGSPDPIPGSPCCDAMSSLNLIAHTALDRQSLCQCLMSLITTYNHNATAIAISPGFCGISLGFTIDPTTDCTFSP